MPDATLSMSLLQQYVYMSRYSRYLHDQGRRETWSETIARYFDFFTTHLKEKHNYVLTKELRHELEMAVLTQQIMPSMRCIMTAGTALARDNIAGYNCLSGDTLVTTLEYGIIPIKELEGKKVHIVDGNGNWTRSKCKSYGEQDLYTVSIASSGRGKFSVKSTLNHRWILKDGTEKVTSELVAGDSLANVFLPDRGVIDATSDDYKKGIVHGIVYGDGSAAYKESSGSRSKDIYFEKTCGMFIIRLCDKSRELLKYFEGYSYSYPKSYNGDPVVYISDRAIDLKSLPEVEKGNFSDEYLLGFMRGWFAADGSVSKSCQTVISSIKEGKDWLYRHGPRLGFVIRNEHKFESETNYGIRKNDLYNLELDRRYLTKDDMILSYKKERYSQIEKKSGFGKVHDISYYGKEKVYCFEVPTTQSFMLTKNLLTGNCSYLSIDNPKSFSEIMYILLCGTGVGFSVERQYVNKLPEVPETMYESDTTVVVGDSKLGWAKSLHELISILYTGNIPKWNTDKVRPAGSILKTFGGRASGPEPLERLFKSIVQTFKEAKGRRLTSLECHDIACMIGDCVVVGGVRRSALISLSNLSDDRMRSAKNGQWWTIHPHRSLSNNSAVYTEKRPSMDTFMNEWKSLYDSKSGERGIFSRYASKSVIEFANQFRTDNFKGSRVRQTDFDFGTNPCSEIILRDKEFCNLSEIVINASDNVESLKKKARLAAILGTFQSTLTDFKFIGKKWKDNTEDERLLGVSLTGIMDHPLTNASDPKKTAELLQELKKVVIQTNMEFAKIIGIPQSVATTCVKPSGTVSTLVDTASGIHARHAPYYLRAVRADKKDPLAQLMIDQGVPHEDDVMRPDHNYVFYFPCKSPKNSVYRNDMSALKQLAVWDLYQTYWCEHKPSVTISVKEDEWFEVGNYVYKNFDRISGVSFLPFSDHNYDQAPFQDLTESQYKEWVAKMPEYVEWEKLVEYEKSDSTTGSQELACTAGAGAEGEVVIGCAL